MDTSEKPGITDATKNEETASPAQDTLKKLVTAATVLGAAAPLLLGSPALASVDSTLDQLAALKQAAISMPSAVEHPVLKDVLAQATADEAENDSIEYGQAYSMYTMTYTMRT